MRQARSFLFGAMLAIIGFSTVCDAAAEPQGGSYVVSGSVTAATSTGGAICIAKGKTVQGYSYFPGLQGKGKNFTIVIPPTTSEPGIVYQFPPMNRFSGSVWRDTLIYVLPPATLSQDAIFSLSFTAYNASSFTVILQTRTGPQGSGPVHSTCTSSYLLHFKLGLPTSLF
jgi:hypothetical protein